MEYTVDSAIRLALADAERSLLINTNLPNSEQLQAENEGHETIYSLISLYSDDENSDGTWEKKISDALFEKYPTHF